MAGNLMGKRFVVSCFGESHGRCVGIIVDGCPAGLSLSEADVQREVDKRKPVSDRVSTLRREEDRVEILSGLYEGYTTGAPICMLVWNGDVHSEAYEEIRWKPRPGHADYTAWVRYNHFNDYRGGGRFSGRLTVGTVMAGAVAKKLLARRGVEVLAHTVEVGGVGLKSKPSVEAIRMNVYSNVMRCADADASVLMEGVVEAARSEGDSVGGVVEAIALNVPGGVGNPVFDSLDADLARAIFNIPAVKGVEFGVGFGASKLRGSANNDPYTLEGGHVVTATNNSGGILGGISDGMPIVVRAAFKPTPSISKKQRTVNLRTMESADLIVGGRHDACIVPRAVPVVESAVALVLADHFLLLSLI